jgi:hypothetical protein
MSTDECRAIVWEEALPARCRPFALRDAWLGPLHYDCARGGHRRPWTGYWLLLVPWCVLRVENGGRGIKVVAWVEWVCV